EERTALPPAGPLRPARLFLGFRFHRGFRLGDCRAVCRRAALLRPVRLRRRIDLAELVERNFDAARRLCRRAVIERWRRVDLVEVGRQGLEITRGVSRRPGLCSVGLLVLAVLPVAVFLAAASAPSASATAASTPALARLAVRSEFPGRNGVLL